MAVPEELAGKTGQAIGAPTVYEIERGAIRRFCEAVDDPNPLHRDAEYARSSKYGGITAPVGFTGWPIKGGGFGGMLGDVIEPIMRCGYPVLLDGGIEYEPFLPIRAGDILVGYSTWGEIKERSTRDGKSMLLPTVEQHFLNQNGDKVLSVRMSFICRQL